MHPVVLNKSCSLGHPVLITEQCSSRFRKENRLTQNQIYGKSNGVLGKSVTATSVSHIPQLIIMIITARSTLQYTIAMGGGGKLGFRSVVGSRCKIPPNCPPGWLTLVNLIPKSSHSFISYAFRRVFYAIWRYSTLLDATLLDATRRYLTLFYSTTLPYATWRYSTLPWR
jgi:hypothetical protein